MPDVIADIKESNAHDRKIDIQSDLAPIELSSRDATTLGIIIGELTMNAIKHAFPGKRSGQIHINLARGENGILKLRIADTGVGLQKKPRKPSGAGLGTVIVNQLCHQFGGSVKYAANGEGGTIVTVDFPSLSEVKPQQSLEQDAER
ncbi:sensor histidine kinase [Phyllobacterium sp. A18/5-2]|nr:sensor histidine kinase [Phyllobacterium sp. A18/5-2]UXN65186.1 sensor histidine kinase [Phyllobacterium sp. A18/5-2]